MNEGTKSVNVRDYYNNGYKEGFQKGKLEERERIRDSIIEVKNSYEIKSRYGEKAVINICAYLKEQLQKEIGEDRRNDNR